MSSKPIRYKPISGNILPQYAGIATFRRLPHILFDAADDLDIGLIGVPWNGGATNRAGARHGPRQMRDLSTQSHNVHHVHGAPLGMVHLDAHNDTWDRCFGDYEYAMARLFGAQSSKVYSTRNRLFR